MHAARDVDQKFNAAPQAPGHADDRGHELHEKRGLVRDPGERKEMAAHRLPDAERHGHDHEQGHERNKYEKIDEVVGGQYAERRGAAEVRRDAQALNDEREQAYFHDQRKMVDVKAGHGHEVVDEFPFGETEFIDKSKKSPAEAAHGEESQEARKERQKHERKTDDGLHGRVVQFSLVQKDDAARGGKPRKREQAGKAVEEGGREPYFAEAVALFDIGDFDAVPGNGADIVEEHADVVEFERFPKRKAQVLPVQEQVPLVRAQDDAYHAGGQACQCVQRIDVPAGRDDVRPSELVHHIRDDESGDQQFEKGPE